MRPPNRTALWTATLSGLVAGMVMSGTMALYGAVFRGDPLYGARVFGALVTRESVLENVGRQAMVTGMFVHLTGPSLFWSRLFGILRGFDDEPVRLRTSLLSGLAIGVVAELLDVRLLLPAIQRATDHHNLWAEHVPAVVDWLAHLVFGLSLGALFWWWMRKR